MGRRIRQMRTAFAAASRYSTVYLRVALAAGFFSAVADRFGLWGPPGGHSVAWGDWAHFVAYAGAINPELPALLVPPVAALATAAEVTLGITLLVGWQTRLSAVAAAILLFLFAAGMTMGTGIKSALDASVLAASAGALLLAAAPHYPLSIDARRGS